MFRKKGQVSIIMILMLIVTLFFYGISFGWRNVAKVKVTTANAAVIGASYVSSMYASYAWMLSNVYLNGKTYKKKCQTNWALVLFPIFSILVLAMAISFEKGASAMVKSWNSQMRKSGVPVVDWLEAGLVTAMQYAAEDSEEIYDISDDNEDGEVCDNYTMSVDKRNCPKVMRPTHYMNRRVASFSRPKEASEEKIEALKEAVRQIAEELGVLSFGDFSDPITKEICQKVPEKCNSCCVSIDDRAGSCTQERIAQCLADDIATYDPMLSTKWDLNKAAGVFGIGDSSSRIKKQTPNDPGALLILDKENVFRPQDFEGVALPLLTLLEDVNVQVSDLTLEKGKKNKKNFVWCDADKSGKTQADGNCSSIKKDMECPSVLEKLGVCTSEEFFTKDCFWGPIKQLEQENCHQDTCCVNKFQQWDGVDYVEADGVVIDKVSNSLSTKLNEIKNIKVSVSVRKDADDFTDKEQEAFDKDGTWPLKNEEYLFLSWINTTLVTTAEIVHLIYGLQTSNIQTLQNQGDMVEELIHSIKAVVDGFKKVQSITKTVLTATTYNQEGSWCLPKDSTNISLNEQNAILYGGGTTWGSLNSVVNCLNYNMNNQQAFDMCLDNCSEFCHDLPRSLVLGFDPNSGQDCSPGSEYLKNIERSSFLAKDQAKKFQQRGTYLKFILDHVKRIHTVAEQYVSLQQKLQALKNAWAAIQAEKEDEIEGAEQDIVYAWMGPALKGKTRGSWHVVGVSGTGKCLSSHCVGREPWIRLKKSRSGFKVCIEYFLEGTANTSTVSVWKWDEDLSTMDKLFKGWFNVEEGNELLKQCVDPYDVDIWCPSGVDASGECTGEQDPYWRPAFVGTMNMKEKRTSSGDLTSSVASCRNKFDRSCYVRPEAENQARQQACSALLKRLKQKAISSTKTVSAWGSTKAKGAPWPPRFTIK